MSQPTNDHSPIHSESAQSGPFMPALVLLGGMALVLLIVMGATAGRPENLPVLPEAVSQAPTAVAVAEEAVITEEQPAAESEGETSIEPEANTEQQPEAVVEAAESQPEAPRTETRRQPSLLISGPQSDYLRYCAACHGENGEGVEFMGPSLSGNDLINNNAELITFLTEGRPLADPRVEFPHPYRGGYPRLTDQQIIGLVGYLHTLG